jgi:hypothetical protein
MRVSIKSVKTRALPTFSKINKIFPRLIRNPSFLRVEKTGSVFAPPAQNSFVEENSYVKKYLQLFGNHFAFFSGSGWHGCRREKPA